MPLELSETLLALTAPRESLQLDELPGVLAEANLESLGLPAARTRAIRSFARAVADDVVRLDRSMQLEALVESLTALDGIGDWTAEYIALRLGERVACPVTDSGLRRAVRPYASGTDLAELAERWRPWRALAAAHLWSTAA